MATRDQERARHAYACVAAAQANKDNIIEPYKQLVTGLGAHVMRSGLAATMAFLERSSETKARDQLFDDLAKANIPHLSCQGRALPEKVRSLDVGEYMLATREFLRVVQWFRRAVQALSET